MRFNKQAVSLGIALIYMIGTVSQSLAIEINSEYNSPAKDLTYVGKFVSSFGSNAVVVGGIMFLIMAIVAGYHMINNSGDADKFAAGKDVITYAVMGFLLIFGAYWIIQILIRVLGLDTNSNINLFK